MFYPFWINVARERSLILRVTKESGLDLLRGE